VEIAVTTDFSLENAHFWRDKHPPESIGHRCLARGLSDLAAMGARPVAAFLSLAVPQELTIASRGQSRRQKSWVLRFLDGLMALAEVMEAPLAGGDTAESPSGLVAADIVLLGAVRRRQALLRSGARSGDLIYVTGALGGAAAELLALKRNPGEFASLKVAKPGHPHLYPEPRLAVGMKLVDKKLATAAIDISDGLSTDLRHLCEESQLAAEIDAAAIPVHSMASLAEAAQWTPSALDLALHGGEDYELLFTASPTTRLPNRIGSVAVHQIGRMTRWQPGTPVVRVNEDGSNRELKAGGWEHFR
jgi:thiamine-monophosphate kinase